MKILVTGGCGFIGSNFIVAEICNGSSVMNLDNLSYAADIRNTAEVENNPNYRFIKFDLSKSEELEQILINYDPDAVVHFAAESHVDNSIANPAIFLETNIFGTYHILNASLRFWEATNRKKFKFIHISTDEVFGSLDLRGQQKFNEASQYYPSSPYSASKAGSDHLVHAWHKTYDLPTVITNCSNNYGPKQHIEKLIPKTIISALKGDPIEIYGDGLNIRDWIYVNDHVTAISEILRTDFLNSQYCLGGDNEVSNIELVRTICDILDRIKPQKSNISYSEQISFVEDRKGHDRRYALDSSLAKSKLKWSPKVALQDGLYKTINWYLKRLIEA